MLARVTSQEPGSDSELCDVWLLWKWGFHFSEIDSDPLQERYAHCTVVELELGNEYTVLNGHCLDGSTPGQTTPNWTTPNWTTPLWTEVIQTNGLIGLPPFGLMGQLDYPHLD